MYRYVEASRRPVAALRSGLVVNPPDPPAAAAASSAAALPALAFAATAAGALVGPALFTTLFCSQNTSL